MKILIVNYYYPPLVGAHAYRWAQLAKLWAAQGHSVTVLTSVLKDAPNREQLDGVDVIRVGKVKRHGAPGVERRLPDNKKSNFLSKGYLISVIRKCYQFSYWPDGLWYWMPSALFGMLRLRRNQYDLVVSYSPTFTAHLATLLYRKLFSKHIRTWVADYGDPFSISDTMPPNNFGLYRKINKIVESSVLKNATCSVFTTEQTEGKYLQHFGKFNSAVIPHMADMSAFYAGDSFEKKLKPDCDRVANLVYVGGFHKGIREPGAMLSFFTELAERYPNSFELNIYGPSNGCDFSICNPPLHYHGSVSRDRAIDLIKSADCLVNIDNKNCLMVPSKLVEYVATGRPIINFTGDNGLVDIMSKYSAIDMVAEVRPIVSDDDFTDVATFIKNRRYRVAAQSQLNPLLMPYDLTSIGERYMSLCS